jgi:Tfp pilus assembly protein PilX
MPDLRLAGERGSALVPALLVMVMLLSFGLSVASAVDTDQGDSRRERERETSFNVTEGALNAQIYQLSTSWPGATSTTAPTACGSTASSAACPDAAALAANFTSVDTAADSSWETQVRDNGGSSPNFWSESLLTTQPAYDANNDNFLWVRSHGIVRGRPRTLVALVEAENVTVNFPRATLVAGHFDVSNNGNKVMIDTNGTANEFAPGDIIVRCSVAVTSCAEYESDKGQIEPDTVRSDVNQPRAVTVEALDQLRERAKSDGNYHTGCGPLMGDQPGEVVFMEDATGCGWQANTVYNTKLKPGYVVIARGAIAEINGNAEFYGIIYHANLDNSTADLITLLGGVSIYGSVVIDGPGGLSAGSNKVNLVYDPNVAENLKAFGTVGIVQNTFREISPNG